MSLKARVDLIRFNRIEPNRIESNRSKLHNHVYLDIYTEPTGRLPYIVAKPCTKDLGIHASYLYPMDVPIDHDIVYKCNIINKQN